VKNDLNNTAKSKLPLNTLIDTVIGNALILPILAGRLSLLL
jgi:hypothetical protein